MRAVRRPSVLLAAALVASGIAMLPAHAADDPTTLAVEGTVRSVVVDRFGSEAASDHLFTVVTDAGVVIPVDLPDETPVNGRFEGELVVPTDVEAALDARGLLPGEGATIAQDTRAGRVAVAEAARQDEPLEVSTASVAPARAAAVTTPAVHRAYVALLSNKGSVEETPAQVKTLVEQMTSYWTTESGGVITSFAVQGDVVPFTTTSTATTAQSCGMGSPSGVWNEARAQFPDVSFAVGSRNHLVVAMADECGDGGIAGIASVGTDLSSGGPMSFTLGDVATQVGVHELGHTFGLGHANLDECPDVDECGDGEYFDLYSPMSLAVGGDAFASPALDSAFRERLGIAPASELTTLTSSGTVTLRPRSDATGVRGAVVVDPVTSARYVVEVRSGTGRDAGTFYASRYSLGAPVTYDPGVTVTTVSDGGELALRTRKASATYDGAFTAGQTFVGPGGSTRIAVGATSLAGTPVTVTLAGTGSPVTPTPTPTPTATPAPTPTPAPAAPAPVLAPPAPAPLSAATPRIVGTAKVGRTLKVKVGSWSPRPAFTYQWFANGRKISSKGTASTFRLTSRQRGQRITVRVTGTRSAHVTTARTSKRTARVAGR
ncbi:M12 family metallo-peptidase [Aeromicrobium fastidiosum]|uniref:M12 family metallo-peptidase n=1 Tax=Aeromicrobium fastidiosum TaxID=52699 RepID=UPI0020237FF4|nr:M12 family metallo-peptidase [Aeromicrobium fastidiosum]MCL8250866.1 M12 family metallo-peptidase [Aeromicrobium fastidiosum]